MYRAANARENLLVQLFKNCHRLSMSNVCLFELTGEMGAFKDIISIESTSLHVLDNNEKLFYLENLEVRKIFRVYIINLKKNILILKM